MIGQPFKDYIMFHINERNEQVKETKNMNVEISPEILAVIQASTTVSQMKGVSASLCVKGSKRRRTREQMDELR